MTEVALPSMKDSSNTLSVNNVNQSKQTLQSRLHKVTTTGTRKIGVSMVIEKVIGNGTFGIVYKARDVVSGDSVALKKIKMERETQGI